MQIAIIGSGVSGNLAARMLAHRHHVTLYEAGGYPGGHSNTVDVELEGRTYPVDTGFMVFNKRTYPNFCRLLDLLGVESQDSDMSFSVSSSRTGLEFQGSSLNGLFAQRSNVWKPSFLRMLGDIARFHRESRGILDDSRWQAATLGEFLTRRRYSTAFTDNYLLPMTAAIWSAPPRQVLEFPLRFLISFFRNHGLVQVRHRPQWKTIVGGARNYVQRLLAPLTQQLRLQTKVAQVTRSEDGVAIKTESGEAAWFDHVVFATHADQTLRMLADADGDEREILGAFPYQTNEAVLHTDPSLLPRSRRAWASWNYHVPGLWRRSVRHGDLRPRAVAKSPPADADSVDAQRNRPHRPVTSAAAVHVPPPGVRLGVDRGATAMGRDQRPPARAFLRGLLGQRVSRRRRQQRLGGRRTLWHGMGSMHSCLYRGYVVHRRRRPIAHRFRYPLYMAYLDLDEAPQLVERGLLSPRRCAAAGFSPHDHLAMQPDGGAPSVREAVFQQTGLRLRGPVRLLTQLRNFGWYFSPLNLYYCFHEDQSSVAAVVAEVSNTPWREQHLYVLWEGNRSDPGGKLAFAHPKQFHVSPFMEMDVEYRWRLSEPREALRAAVSNRSAEGEFFTAALSLSRLPLDRRRLGAALFQYPMMTARIMGGIYFQALQLWWKACPSYPHPNKAVAATSRN